MKKVRLIDANTLCNEIESLRVTVTGISSQVPAHILLEYESHIKDSVLTLVHDSMTYAFFEED